MAKVSAAKVLKLSVIKELYHKKRATPDWMLLPLHMRLINIRYETSMALVTFSFGSVFGIVMVRMPSSTLAEI